MSVLSLASLMLVPLMQIASDVDVVVVRFRLVAPHDVLDGFAGARLAPAVPGLGRVQNSNT